MNQSQATALRYRLEQLCTDNCRIRTSRVESVGDLEMIGKRVFVAVTIADTGERPVFRTHAVFSIGPRGGIRALSTHRYF